MNILHIILAHWIFTFYSAKFQKRAIGHFRLPIICWKLIRVNGILRLVNGVRWGFDLLSRKFWKIINFYYNSRKSWMPNRNYEKLESLIRQEQNKEKLVHKLFGVV